MYSYPFNLNLHFNFHLVIRTTPYVTFSVEVFTEYRVYINTHVTFCFFKRKCYCYWTDED